MFSKSVFLVILLCLILSSHVEAATYYVAKSGSDSNLCIANDETKARQTIDAGIACLKGGDRLEIKTGTYVEPKIRVESGSSWTAATTITRYKNDTVTLTNGGGICFLYGPCAIQRYVIIDGFIWDGTSGPGAEGVDHVRLINNEIKNKPQQGLQASGSFNEIINNKIHDIGTTDFDHGIYFSGDNTLVEGNEFYQITGWGIHKYPHGDNNIIRNNKIYNNATLGERGVGVGLYGGRGNQVYNNLIWGNSVGVNLDYGESDAKIYNNTIYKNTYNCMIITGASNTSIKNNICSLNPGDISDSGTGTVISNNLMTDPKFVNPSTFDFRLQTGSPAIDTGTPIALVLVDIAGVPRPQGSAYDIGAYEFKSGTVAVLPRAPSGLRVQ